jgi:hypothetical protein
VGFLVFFWIPSFLGGLLGLLVEIGQGFDSFVIGGDDLYFDWIILPLVAMKIIEIGLIDSEIDDSLDAFMLGVD